MALDYYKVQPDRVALLGKHFTPGSLNRNIQYITRHHTAGVLDADALNRVWDSRPASTHYLADPKGVVSQHVWDRDVAWSNGNAASNAVTITIEHANSAGGGSDWPISDATITAGARWAAALCLYYKLGRPQFGKNIRDHREFTTTSCPYHLANGGKYHRKWMDEATRFYDALVNKTVNPDGTPKSGAAASSTTNEEELSMSAVQELKDYLDVRVTGPIGSDVKDVRQQLTGGRDAGEYPGYAQIDNRTVVDALAVIGEKLGIPGFYDPHGGSLKAQQEKEADQ